MRKEFNVVGGTYVERTREPATYDVMGSGLRAAAILGRVAEVRLHTLLDGETRQSALALSSSAGFSIESKERSRPVVFTYHTPISSPTIDGLPDAVEDIMVSAPGSPALVYGMLDAYPSVEASGIVYDPQRPRGPLAIDRSRLRCDRFAIVANESELGYLGGSRDLDDAARRLMNSSHADVIVLKRGPLGATVFVKGQEASFIGPHKTERVWPLGSGDVFSAVFAWAWLCDGRLPGEAARIASAATSNWCSNRSVAIPISKECSPSDVAAGPELKSRSERVPIYLAGPFFNIAERWLVSLVRNSLVAHGGSVFSPYHDVGPGGDEVAAKDLKGLDGCAVILGLLDGADAGTLFEVGYAAARGIPTVGLAENPQHEDYKMLRGLGTYVSSDLSSVVYQAIWEGMEERGR